MSCCFSYKKVGILLLILINFSILSAFGKTYYISNMGMDANDGQSPSSPWSTLSRLSQQKLLPGDEILFRRGDIWREQLRPASGSSDGYIRYGAYGSGDKPTFLGSINKSRVEDWKKINETIWSTSLPAQDIGNIIFNNGTFCGVKKWDIKDLVRQGDFFFDQSNQLLMLYSQKNPENFYINIECALRRNIIEESNTSWVIFENLSLKYGAAHGIGGGNTHHIIIRRCDISYIGGGEQYTGQDKHKRRVRFGNGIEFWGSAHDNLVEDCRIWEIFDAALTNQNSIPNSDQNNIIYNNNTIWNAEYSFEYWNGPENSNSHDIAFNNNTCVNAGGGWGHSQRPDPSGFHLNFGLNPASTKGIVIHNNIFYEAKKNLFRAPSWSKFSIESLDMDNNCWFQQTGIMINLSGIYLYTKDQFGEFKNELNIGKNSIVAIPSFISPLNNDYHQKENSKCINAGVKQN